MIRKKLRRWTQKLQKAEFDFNDFLDQMQPDQKDGRYVRAFMSMMPGMGPQMKEMMDVDDKAMARVEAIILSMTT